ncbi:MAG: zf-HC2 domain-containing protein [Gemmatimonadota bacterium]|nr:zf-HC2 domain-containing protein [Gemmatimonadota bacterium]
MNNCIERDIQEMLPDLLHRRLDATARSRVEAHLTTCAACAEDLEVLRTVQAATVFIPAIDVNRVVGQIPPYSSIVPVAQAPARSRAVSWLVAASLAVVVLGGGSLLMIQPRRSVAPVASVDRTLPPIGASSQSGSTGVIAPVAAATPTHSLAMATGVDGLSDTNLRQLMNDMNGFDALPAAEPEPVISVDNSDSLDEGSR